MKITHTNQRNNFSLDHKNGETEAKYINNL